MGYISFFKREDKELEGGQKAALLSAPGDHKPLMSIFTRFVYQQSSNLKPSWSELGHYNSNAVQS